MNFISKILQTDFNSRKKKRIAGLDGQSEPFTEGYSSLTPLYGIPLVSVVLPIFNHANLVSESIDSVLNQELPLELIIVDDGSTDNLDEVLKPYLSDTRVRFFRKENGGISSALNLGFQNARASFLSWTSADNRFLPGALKVLCQTLLENPSASLAYGNVELIDETGRLITNSEYRKSDQVEGGLHLTREGASLFYYDDNFINSCFLYRRSFSNLVGDYSSSVNGAEDYEYWLRLTAFSSAVHTTTAKPLYQYRLHANSLTSNLDGDRLATLTREIRLAVKGEREKINSRLLPGELTRAVDDSALNIPVQINRARDGDFRSLAESSGINFGVIYSSGEELLLEESFNISIYPLNPVSGEFADQQIENLHAKGFTIFNDHPEVPPTLPESEYRARSLMFYLSRVDALILPSRSWSPEELRYKAGLAAAAGVELRVLKRSELKVSDIEFLDLFLPAPHITFYDTLEMALQTELRFNLTRGYFDKWLHSQSFNGISALVKTGMLSKKLEKAFS